MEAGIVLSGTEIKSIRAGKVEPRRRVRPDRARARRGSSARTSRRGRAERNEPRAEAGPEAAAAPAARSTSSSARTKAKGLTLVPLKLYITERGKAKLELGLGKGKQLYDRRREIAAPGPRRDGRARAGGSRAGADRAPALTPLGGRGSAQEVAAAEGTSVRGSTASGRPASETRPSTGSTSIGAVARFRVSGSRGRGRGSRACEDLPTGVEAAPRARRASADDETNSAETEGAPCGRPAHSARSGSARRARPWRCPRRAATRRGGRPSDERRLHAEVRGLPEDDVGERPGASEPDVRGDAVRDRRLDRDLGEVASTRALSSRPSRPRPAVRREAEDARAAARCAARPHGVGELERPPDRLHDPAHPLRVGVDDRDRAELVERPSAAIVAGGYARG